MQLCTHIYMHAHTYVCCTSVQVNTRVIVFFSSQLPLSGIFGGWGMHVRTCMCTLICVCYTYMHRYMYHDNGQYYSTQERRGKIVYWARRPYIFAGTAYMLEVGGVLVTAVILSVEVKKPYYPVVLGLPWMHMHGKVTATWNACTWSVNMAAACELCTVCGTVTLQATILTNVQRSRARW